jgi:site-specific recombinase XerD
MTNDLTLITGQAIAVPIPVSQNPAVVYIASLTSAQSRRTMRTALETIAALLTDGKKGADDLPWAALRYEHTNAIRARLAEHYAAATANKLLSALKGVLKAAYHLGLMQPDEYAKATAIKAVKGETTLKGRDLDDGEIIALVATCRKDRNKITGQRDVAIIGLLATCGLRRAELVALDVSDYEPSTGRISVRSGKGNKFRTVYAAHGAKAALEDWLKLRGDKPGPLFWVIGRGNNALIGQRLTTQAIYKMLKFRAMRAGVKDFSPHDFRRTFVGNLLDRGADISQVAKLAGHASVTTTQRYDRRNEETKQRTASLLHFPYRSADQPPIQAVVPKQNRRDKSKGQDHDSDKSQD